MPAENWYTMRKLPQGTSRTVSSANSGTMRPELDTAQDNAEGAPDTIGEAPPQTVARPSAADGRPATGDGTGGSEIVRLRTRDSVARGADAAADISAAPSQNAPPVLVADNAGLVADGIGKRFKQRQVLRGVLRVEGPVSEQQ